MDKSAFDGKNGNNKVSAEKAEEIKASKQIAVALKGEWEELRKNQEKRGRKIQSGQRIKSISLVKNRRGKTIVKVGMENGGKVFDDAKSKTVYSFKEKAQSTYRKLKIEDLLRKIREKGWDAVEGEIPPELKEAVLKACERANISITSKGEKEAEERQLAVARKVQEETNKTTIAAAAEKIIPSIVIPGIAVPVAMRGLTPARKEHLQVQAKQLIDTTMKYIETSPIFKDMKVKEIQQSRPDSRSAKVTVEKKMVDGVVREMKLVGDAINVSGVKIAEAEHLLMKKQNGEPLSAQEEARLKEWEKNGIRSFDDLAQKGGGVACKVSEKGMTGDFGLQLKKEKVLRKEISEKELLSLDNPVSAAKIEQIKFVLEKTEKGIPLSVPEKYLSDYVHTRIKDSTELNDPTAREKVAEVLGCRKRFMYNEDGTLTPVAERRAILARDPALYQEQEARGAFPKPAERKILPLTVGPGTTIEELNAATRCAKDASSLSHEDKVKSQLLNMYANMHGTDKVDSKALAWAKENAPVAGALLKKRGELERQGLTPEVLKKEIEKAAAAARQTSTPTETPKSPVQLKTQEPSKAEKPKEQEPSKAEKDRVVGKIKENMAAYKASAEKKTEQQPAPAPQPKPVGLQKKVQQKAAEMKKEAVKTPAPAPISPAVQAAINKKKEDLSR